MTRWKDAVALVTGGGSGIGRELSRALARRGALVHVSDVNAVAAEETAAEIGRGARATAVDVRHADAVRAWIEGVVAERGRIDFLFNNAGISVKGEAEELAVAHWDRLIDVNLRGVVHGVVAAYPIMVKQRSGHIVNTASMAGLGPTPLLTPYGATKHAIVGLSTSLRIEAHAYGVRVSVLCPSTIETPALDRVNPDDLPQPSWHPNMRRYLKGPWSPFPADRLAEETLDAVERNVGIIVLPTRARAAWRMNRWLPALVEGFLLREVARERRDRKSGV